ncbi:MAG: hypothetical protein ABSA53_35810 [Streptosporangiaceae bacterium]|jgi:hypothetical protein
MAELKRAAGPGAKIMLGFDRGGAYPQVFTHCRTQDVHWVTCRRAPMAVPVMLPVITTISYGGRTRQITWAEETVQVKDYGEARQITLFEHGRVALQILTPDFDACPADILAWLKSRWREENFLNHLHPRRDHRPPRAAPRPPHRPRPGPAHPGDQRHPARHARRQPPHHLPRHPQAQHLTSDAQSLPEI